MSSWLLAMENDGEAVEGQVEELGLSADTVDGVAELEAGAGEIDRAAVAAEDAAASAEDLEEVADQLAAGVESGEGVSEETARMAEIAVESATRRLLGRRSASFVAVENFGGRQTKLQATKLAMEGVIETVKRIWEAVKKAVKDMWAKVMDFFGRATANLDKVEADAAKLRERVRGVTGSIKEKDVTSGSVLSAFSVDGKCTLETAKEISANTVVLVETTLEGLNKAEVNCAELTKIASNPGEYKVGVLRKILFNVPFSKAKGVKSQKKNKNGADVATLDLGPIYRGQLVRMVVTMPKDDEGDLKSSLSMEIVQQSKSADKTKTLSTSEMDTALDLVDTLTEATRKFDKKKDELAAVSSALTKVADAAMSFATAKMENKDANVAKERAMLNEVRSMVSSMNSINGRLSANAPAWALSNAKALMTYVDASIRNHGSKKD